LIYCLFIPIAIAAQPYDRTSPDPDMPRPIPARDSVFTGFLSKREQFTLITILNFFISTSLPVSLDPLPKTE